MNLKQRVENSCVMNFFLNGFWLKSINKCNDLQYVLFVNAGWTDYTLHEDMPIATFSGMLGYISSRHKHI
jgi:hypothetical protein